MLFLDVSPRPKDRVQEQALNDVFHHPPTAHYCVSDFEAHNRQFFWDGLKLLGQHLLLSVLLEPHPIHVGLLLGQEAYLKAFYTFDQSHFWTYTLLLK